MLGRDKLKLVALVAAAVVGSELVLDICTRLPLPLADWTGPLLNALLITLLAWLITGLAGNRWREVGWTGLSGLLSGIGLGGIVVVAILGVASGLGTISVSPARGLTGNLAYLVSIFALVAYSEELLYRGVVQRLHYRLAGRYGALVVTSVLFALVHLSNPYARPGIVGLATLFFVGWLAGALYLGAGSLWLAVGWRFGWNVVQMGLLPMVTYTGSAWAVPGLFGVEGWPVAAVVTGLAAVAATWWAHLARQSVSTTAPRQRS